LQFEKDKLGKTISQEFSNEQILNKFMRHFVDSVAIHMAWLNNRLHISYRYKRQKIKHLHNAMRLVFRHMKEYGCQSVQFHTVNSYIQFSVQIIHTYSLVYRFIQFIHAYSQSIVQMWVTLHSDRHHYVRTRLGWRV